jgi:phage/plasmid-associated DNA primase
MTIDMAGYKNLRDKEYEFIESASIDKAKENYKKQSNSVFNFINETLVKGEQDDVIMMKNLYDAYKDFCNSEGEKTILTKSEFKKVLKDSGYTIENSSRHNNSVCVFNVTCN